MINHNIVKKITYFIAYPLALLFFKLKISANSVTFLSLVMSVLAGISLSLNLNPIYFTFFWILNILLDFSDGTVARLYGKQNSSIINIDHMTDLLKFGIIWISAGISYSNTSVWISAFACCFLHLYFNIISHDYNNYTDLREKNKKNVGGLSFFKKNPIFRNVYELLFSIDGHSLYYFLLLPISKSYAMYVFIYFSTISILRSLVLLYKLNKMK